MATALHEILAVEQGLGETANRVQKSTTKTLTTKPDLFEGLSKEHVIFDDALQHLVQPTDIKEVQSTVKEQVDFATAEIARYWDVILQKEDANQRAKADIKVGDKVLAKDVPAMALLSMEKKLESLLSLYNAIPTLDAAKSWVQDESGRPGIFVTKNATERQQSITKSEWIEVSPATVQHKAQIVENTTTEVVGKYIVNDFSGKISSYEKSEKIRRLTEVIRAVKSARQRANTVEVNTSITFADALFGYING